MRLSEKLKAEGSGILAWAVEGCLAWQRTGLNPPEKTRIATAAYFADENIVAQWVADHCIVTAGYFTPVAEAYRDWAGWFKAGALTPVQSKVSPQTLRVCRKFIGTARHGNAVFGGLLCDTEITRRLKGQIHD